MRSEMAVNNPGPRLFSVEEIGALIREATGRAAVVNSTTRERPTMLTNLVRWLPCREANQACSSGPSVGSLRSSTSRAAGGNGAVGAQNCANAILEVRRRGLRAGPDSEGLFYEVTDVERAMTHASAIPAGRYVVFRDTSGRILLQAAEKCLSPGARMSRRQTLGKQ